MNWKHLFLALGILLTGLVQAEELGQEGWSAYRKRFITAEGRVIDTANGNVSHSEGQGYGLLLAEGYGDRETFQRLAVWTIQNLQIRNDALLAWRWNPSVGRGQVDDTNNATDGDILVAWALARAAKTWKVAAYREEARRIATNIRALLVRPSPFGPLLLPGAVGFEKEGVIVINPSYWVFPAFRELNEIDPSPVWEELERSGHRICNYGRYGGWHLPPEWIWVRDAELELPTDVAPVFGYNAIRVPFYLYWAGYTTHPCVLAAKRYSQYASRTGKLSATIDLSTGIAGADPMPQGMQNALRFPIVANPLPNEAEAYYPASISLLVNLVAKNSSQSITTTQEKTFINP